MQSRSRDRTIGSAALAIAGALCVLPASAQSVAEFYKDKTVTLISSSAPGGGYDTLSRIIANHLGRHLPGSPAVVVKNMAGAGGIVATNHLYNVAAKDGTVIGGVQNNTPFEPLFGAKGPTYDPLKFNWLGTPSIEVAICTVWHTAPVSTWQEAQQKEFTMGSSGVNSTPSFYGRLLNETLGFKQKIIVGYQSQTHAFLAMERGEVDGYPSVFYNSLMAGDPPNLDQGKEGQAPGADGAGEGEADSRCTVRARSPYQSGRQAALDRGLRAAAGRPALPDAARRARRPGRGHAEGDAGHVPRSGLHGRDQQARHGRKLAAQRGGVARSAGAGLHQDPGSYRQAAAEDFDALSAGCAHRGRSGVWQ
jgi:hypothetical protein